MADKAKSKKRVVKGKLNINSVVPYEDAVVHFAVSDRAYKGHRDGTASAIAHRVFDRMRGKKRYRQVDIVKAMSALAEITQNSAGVLYNRFRAQEEVEEGTKEVRSRRGRPTKKSKGSESRAH